MTVANSLRWARDLLLGLLLNALVMTGATTSYAEDFTPIYKDAQELFLQKKYMEALPLFQKVAEGLDSPNAQLYVARCYHETAHHVDAYHAMNKTVAMAKRRSKTEERFAKTAAAAEEELARYEKYVGRVAIRTDLQQDDLRVVLNGEEVSNDELGQSLVVVPGAIRIDATAAACKPFHLEFEIEPGQHREEVLPCGPRALPMPPPPPQRVVVPTPQRPPGSPLTTLQILGIGATSVGGINITLGIITATLADAKYDQLSESCNGRCTADKQSDIDLGRNLDTVALVGFISGGIAVVGGLSLVIFGGDGDSDEANDAPTQPDDTSLRPRPGVGRFDLLPVAGGSVMQFHLTF